MDFRLEQISKIYERGNRKQVVLQNVNQTISAGTFWMVQGRSGSGKSTLLHLLSGLTCPTAGKIFYGDTEITGLHEAQKAKLRGTKLSVVTQDSALIPYLTLSENVDLPGRLRKKSGKLCERDRIERIEKWLDAVGLLELRQEYPAHLSGGEIKRGALARALASDAPALILDEPTANLDQDNVDRVLHLLRQVADQGKTVIIATHEAQAQQYADVVMYLDETKNNVEAVTL